MHASNRILDDQALDILFREARTHGDWQEKDIPDVLVHALYDLMRWGPTSANSCPGRFVFIRSPEAKNRLRPHLNSGNVDKTMAAPLTVIIAQDMKFYDHLPRLFPHEDARIWFAGKERLIEETALRNSSLQGAYLMMAARALGLDCGPMSGFDRQGITREFFAGTDTQPNFLCNLGYGELSSLHPRLPRFSFNDVCDIL